MARQPSLTTGDPSTVQLVDVAHRYGERIALESVSLQVEAGELVGVIGPDGVGKSTLLALIAGVRRCQQGQIVVLGGDLTQARMRRSICARIAYMPQGLGQNLYPSLSVRENLDFFARLFGTPAGERETRINRLLEATGLAPFRDREMAKLSGGMKQKLGLCAALIHDPDILILDEPTTGVDPLSRQQFWALIARIRKRRPHMSVMVATAYMEEADDFERLIAMDAGRILAIDTPDALRERTGTQTLDAAFTALLPSAQQGTGGQLTVPPQPTAEHTPTIEAVNLTRRFGDFTAVNKVNFTIARGEIFGFVGSNGCGKTTTMKMLTGLLAPTDGEARLFDSPVDTSDLRTRRRVGYMSQAFSLYGELSVRQNLDLHARLFRVPALERRRRIEEVASRFDLIAVSEDLPGDLPLGIRQRLSLAIAVIHQPELLILDEPTSGVDPVARDRFWRFLIELSRDEGVTIFISTHFMNEAARCDRVSLMHEGKVLAVGPPAELAQARGVASLEDAFIAYLQDLTGNPLTGQDQEASSETAPVATQAHRPARMFDINRLWAYGRREMIEVLRDRIRLAFALLGPVILMIAFSYGISFDVDDLKFAALDGDRTPASRELIASFESSRYFKARADLVDPDDIGRRLSTGELLLAIEVPAGFGRDLTRGRTPEIGIWLDGALPFRAETACGYAMGVIDTYLSGLAAYQTAPDQNRQPFRIEPRFRYNQAFTSVHAMVPGTIMLLMIMIPAMMTAVGVVREKELGSITNLYATPVTRLEFLLGKQAPYVAISLFSFVTLVLLATTLFQVPVKGSGAALAAGALAYLAATTGFGLLISSFVRTQIAAIFATSILSIVSSINFSGLFQPVSTLEGVPYAMAVFFPANYFQQISVGTFTKGLGLMELWPNHLILAGFAALFLGLALLFLRKQEA
ncbi:MAG: ribosome-associated ATPase/putative transporter RbbA [Alphaproteobacteria bacterium]